jgi:hypothetical protein
VENQALLQAILIVITPLLPGHIPEVKSRRLQQFTIRTPREPISLINCIGALIENIF